MSKIAFIDIESIVKTGEITQIKIKPCIEGKMKRGINLLIKYTGKCGNVARQRAHNNKAITIVAAFRKLETYLGQFVDRFNPNDKLVLIGHNVSFDTDKLRDFFTLNGSNFYGSYFYQQAICTIQMATLYLTLSSNMNQVQSFKLCDLCTYFSIKVDESKLHEAEYDVDLLIKLYKKLTDAMHRMWTGPKS